jgi:uncharacterized protein (TIGR02001 family)
LFLDFWHRRCLKETGIPFFFSKQESGKGRQGSNVKKRIDLNGILGIRALMIIVITVLLTVTAAGLCFGEEQKEDTGSLFALKNFSATAAITSDYVFRGLSQTDEDPAVQLSLDYKHPVGIFMGVWGSSVDEFISEGNVELDLYAGFRNQIVENLTYELSVIYYWYPGDGRDPEKDYVEGHVGLSYAFPKVALEPNLGLGFNYSPDYYGEDGDAYYVNGTLRLALPHQFGLGFELGYQIVEGDKTTGNGLGLAGEDGYDYVFWRIGLSKELLGFVLDLSYYDTNESEFFGKIGDDRVVFTISRSF